MKKILFLFLISNVAFGQIKVQNLPTKTTNFNQGDNLIIDNYGGGTGATGKITVGSLKANYEIVSTVSVTPTGGVSGTVTNPTTTPGISIVLGSPLTVGGYSVTVLGTSTITGSNTGDQDLSGLVPYLNWTNSVNATDKQIVNVNKIGIGVTIPNNQLEVYGNAGLMNESANAPNSFITGLYFRNSYSSTIVVKAGIEAWTDNTVHTGKLYFKTDNLGSAATTKMVLQGNGILGVGTTTPDSSAILDLTSVSRGFLPPRMTTTERNNIGGAVNGLFIYNSTTNAFNGFQGGSWGAIGGNISTQSLQSTGTYTLDLNSNALTYKAGQFNLIGNGATGGTTTLSVKNSAGVQSVSILGNGKVGIGTSSQTWGFQIDAATATDGFRINNTSGSGFGVIQPSGANDIIYFVASGSAGGTRGISMDSQNGAQNYYDTGGKMTFGSGGGTYNLTVGGTTATRGLLIQNTTGSSNGIYLRPKATNDIEMYMQNEAGTKILSWDSQFDILSTTGDIAVAGAIKSTSTETVVSNSTSGTTQFSQPFAGTTFKKVLIKCVAALGTASYTFPVAFAAVPMIITSDQIVGGVVTALSTTAVTITGATTTGYLTLEGD